MMMVSVSRLFGVLAMMALLAPATGVTAIPLTEEGPLAPQPVVTTTLPGPLSAGEYIYFDDFSWCETPPCDWNEGPHVRTHMNDATGSAFATTGAWQVAEGGLDGTPALAFNMDAHPGSVFALEIRPKTPFASVGSDLSISIVATQATNMMLHEGGLRVQIHIGEDHMGDLQGPYDCMMVPGPSQGGDFHELVPLNPLCKVVPATTKVALTFTVEESLLGERPDKVAIDSILVERL